MLKRELLLIAALFLVACRPATKFENSVGPQGPKGDTGAPGLIGPVGPQGPRGTLIFPVKFCPQPAVYPSTFPEYGLCIEGKMYGVYSTNGGFFAYLPSGTYSSAGVGSSCTFTITGCNISH